MRVPLNRPATLGTNRNETELTADFAFRSWESPRWPKLLQRRESEGVTLTVRPARGAMMESHFGQIYAAALAALSMTFLNRDENASYAP